LSVCVCVCLAVGFCVAIVCGLRYVTLTTLATGRFSENAFVLLPGAPKSLAFLPYTDQPVDLDLLKSSIRVEHLASYLVQ
jgi:hypothetical protein